MKKLSKTLCCFFLAALCLTNAACSSQQESEGVTILATFYPIYTALLNIAGGIDGVKVEMLAPATAGCLHDYQLTTADRGRVDAADIIVKNGAGMEAFLDKVTDGKQVIDASEGFALVAPSVEHDHEADEHEAEDHADEHADEINPHVWVAPEGAIYQAERIRDGLMDADPTHADQYYANANAYIDSLLELQSNMHASLAPIKGGKVVMLHDSFAYFAQEFGLEVVAVLKAEPESQLSAKEINDAAGIAASEGAVAIFSEVQYDDAAAQTLSRETGIEVYALDSAVTGEADTPAAYLEAMDFNTIVIAIAMGLYAE
jgi:zinc transport system substrate-binding protein